MNSVAILVVDDEPEGADLLVMLLKSVYPDADLNVAYDGRAALDSALQQPPEVAILDLEMPLMDGVQLAVALRQVLAGRPPLLIALSGNLVRISELRGKGIFDHMFSKPADVGALLALIDHQVAMKQG